MWLTRLHAQHPIGSPEPPEHRARSPEHYRVWAPVPSPPKKKPKCPKTKNYLPLKVSQTGDRKGVFPAKKWKFPVDCGCQDSFQTTSSLGDLPQALIQFCSVSGLTHGPFPHGQDLGSRIGKLRGLPALGCFQQLQRLPGSQWSSCFVP